MERHSFAVLLRVWTAHRQNRAGMRSQLRTLAVSEGDFTRGGTASTACFAPSWPCRGSAPAGASPVWSWNASISTSSWKGEVSSSGFQEEGGVEERERGNLEFAQTPRALKKGVGETPAKPRVSWPPWPRSSQVQFQSSLLPFFLDSSFFPASSYFNELTHTYSCTQWKLSGPFGEYFGQQMQSCKLFIRICLSKRVTPSSGQPPLTCCYRHVFHIAFQISSESYKCFLVFQWC